MPTACFYTPCYVRAPVLGARALPGCACPESTSLDPSAAQVPVCPLHLTPAFAGVTGFPALGYARGEFVSSPGTGEQCPTVCVFTGGAQ